MLTTANTTLRPPSLQRVLPKLLCQASDTWFEKLANSYAVPEEYCRDTALWLLISHVFGKRTIIDAFERRAFQGARGPFNF